MTATPGEQGSPLRNPEPREDDARVHRAVALLPYLLLGLALTFTLIGGTDGTPWVIALTTTTLALRLWWQFTCPSPHAQAVCFALNLILTLGLLSFSPFYGVYAFAGYLDAVAVFGGTAQIWALVAAASLNAAAQTGGPQGAVRYPWLFGFLLLANAGLAVIMVHIDKHRQRTVAQLRQTLTDLERAQHVNAELQEQLIDQAKAAGVLEERQRVSREIHDTVAQGLIALLRQIETASEAASLHEVRQTLERADRTARDNLAEARRAVAALASPWLDQTDLPEAIRNLVADWAETNAVTAKVTVRGTPTRTAWDASMLRICQEGLANIAKHSNATTVDVTLNYSGAVTLTVSDDGVGFAADPATLGHGIRGMQARLAAAGGQLHIESKEGQGCTLTATIPM